MIKFTVRHLVHMEIIQTVLVAEDYNIDDGLVTFSDDDDDIVYVCNVSSLLDITPDYSHREDDMDDEEFLEALGMVDALKVHSENSTLKEHPTVLPKEHS